MLYSLTIIAALTAFMANADHHDEMVYEADCGSYAWYDAEIVSFPLAEGLCNYIQVDGADPDIINLRFECDDNGMGTWNTFDGADTDCEGDSVQTSIPESDYSCSNESIITVCEMWKLEMVEYGSDDGECAEDPAGDSFTVYLNPETIGMCRYSGSFQGQDLFQEWREMDAHEGKWRTYVGECDASLQFSTEVEDGECTEIGDSNYGPTYIVQTEITFSDDHDHSAANHLGSSLVALAIGLVGLFVAQ